MDLAGDFDEKTPPPPGDSPDEDLLNWSARAEDFDAGVEGRGSRSPPESAASSELRAATSNGSAEGNAEGSPPAAATPVQGSVAAGTARKPRRWRRLQRGDVRRDGTGAGAGPGPSAGNSDSAQFHKRRIPSAQQQRPGGGDEFPLDGEGESSAASVASHVTESIQSSPFVVAAENSADRGNIGSGLDPELLISMGATQFSFGVDSDNSDDRSVKSTAASMPRTLRHDIFGSGMGRERGRLKVSGTKGSGHAVSHRGGRVRGLAGSRGDRDRAELDNSRSTGQSEPWSFNATMQNGSVVGDGLNSEKSVGFDGIKSDDGQNSEEVRSSYHDVNGSGGDLFGGSFEADLLEGNGHGAESNGLHTDADEDVDPFAESMDLLQISQDKLELEIQKLQDMWKETDEESDENESVDAPVIETSARELINKVKQLENKLNVALAAVSQKDSQLHELERQLDKIQLSEAIPETAVYQSFKQKSDELELDTEGLLEQRIAVEIQSLIMSRATESWKLLAEDQLALFEANQTLRVEHDRLQQTLRSEETRSVLLQGQVEKLEQDCETLSVAAETLKLKNCVYRSSINLIVQVLILLFALWLFVKGSAPPPLPSASLVPT